MTLLYLTDTPHHWAGWTLTASPATIGTVTNTDPADCAELAAGSWEILMVQEYRLGC